MSDKSLIVLPSDAEIRQAARDAKATVDHDASPLR